MSRFLQDWIYHTFRCKEFQLNDLDNKDFVFLGFSPLVDPALCLHRVRWGQREHLTLVNLSNAMLSFTKLSEALNQTHPHLQNKLIQTLLEVLYITRLFWGTRITLNIQHLQVYGQDFSMEISNLIFLYFGRQYLFLKNTLWMKLCVISLVTCRSG